MTCTPQTMALWLTSFIVVGSMLFFRIRETGAETTSKNDFGGTVCCGIEHPRIKNGLVCAPGPAGLVPAAVDRLDLPNNCLEVPLPQTIEPGSRLMMAEENGLCTLQSIEKMSGAGRLLTGVGIDVNTADATDLELLPGIGETKARAIVTYREKKGPFLSLDDLVMVKGIGTKILKRLTPWVYIAGTHRPKERLPR